MIDWKELRKYLNAKPATSEEYPFGPEAAVFKVGGRIYAIVGWMQLPLSISLKCDPHEAEVLRSTYPSIRPGYHMNQRHWNTVTIDVRLPEDLLLDMIDESYDLVFERLPMAVRAEIG